MLLLKRNKNLINVSLNKLQKIEFDYSRFIIKYDSIEIIVKRNSFVESDEIYFALKDVETDYEIIDENEFKDILKRVGKNDV